MSKIRWMLGALVLAVIGLVPVLGSTAPAGADPGTILKFDVMAPVTGPYVGTGNPIRMVPGGGLPWMIREGTGFLTRDGRLQIHVRGLVLADDPAVPANLRGTNPVPDFEAIVSCQTISATGGHRHQRQHRPVPGQHRGELRHQRHGEPAPPLHRAHRVRVWRAERRLVRSHWELSRQFPPAWPRGPAAPALGGQKTPAAVMAASSNGRQS